MASAIQNSVYEQTHPKPPPQPAPPKPEEKGPLKEILAHQDSLYNYISWEDPLRTISSYMIAMSLLAGFHFMPLTLWALKAGAYTFGAVSVAEFVSRSLGPDTFLSRLRPKPYRKVPERVLNATLKDFHDFTQYSVVQAQQIMFGQDLHKTFAAFLGCTALYWLIQIASPFALSVVALTSLYIAPLAVSRQGRQLANQVAHDGSVLAGDIANKAVDSGKSAMDRGQSMANSTVDSTKSAIDSGKSLANDGMARASEQTAKARDTVVDTSSRVGTAASEQTANARDSVMDTSNRIGTAASNLTGYGKQEAKDIKKELEDQSNYVVDHKPHGTSPSSIPRASHRSTHPSEQATNEDGRKAHVYSDPLGSRY